MIKSTVMLLVMALTLVSCGGGGGGRSGGGSNNSGGSNNGGSTSTYGLYTSSSISGNQFVNALNDFDGADLSELMVDEYNTIRSNMAGEDLWFVIYDGGISEYVSINLYELRRVQYYAYARDDVSLAGEYASIVDYDLDNGYEWGDGVLYNIVDPFIEDGVQYYEDYDGYIYNKGKETTDLSLMAAQAEDEKVLHRASALSLTYSLNKDSAIRLAKFGNKVENMMKEGSLSLSNIDDLAGDLQGIANISVTDLLEAATNESSRDALVEKVANDVGMPASTLKQKLLPELFGVNL